LRALNDTLDANVVQIITKLCQQADCLEDFWAVVVNSDADLRMFLGCLLRIGHGNFIKKKVMAVEDKTQRSRIVNTLWNGMFFASKNQKILLTNAQTVKEVLGALSITEEIKRFAQGPKTAVEGEIFGWHEKLKKEHIQKVLKPLL
jgi:predicted nucleotide-binding protein (sugar kinase/HSP70/actin superfamily)